MSAAFEKAWARTGRAEGGYANHPNDPGGETNHGITLRVARADGYLGHMKDLTPERARSIAKRQYWDVLRLDEIDALSFEIAQELFDTNFNLWYGAAGKFLQRGLNALNRQGRDYADLNADGNIGDKTIAALTAFIQKRGAEGRTVLARVLNAQQCEDYRRQCSESVGKEDFFFGWVLHRVAL